MLCRTLFVVECVNVPTAMIFLGQLAVKPTRTEMQYATSNAFAVTYVMGPPQVPPKFKSTQINPAPTPLAD